MHILASRVFIHFWAYFAFGFSDLQNFQRTHVKILIFSAVAAGDLNEHTLKGDASLRIHGTVLNKT